MEKHGTASIGQYVEFQAAVLRQLPRPEEFSSEILEGWTKNQSSLQRVLRGVLLPAEGAEDKDGYLVILDYAHTLTDMIHAGHYDRMNDDITAEHFPITGDGVVEAKMELVHFNRPMNSEDVLKEFAETGLEPAKIEHLLAFGAKHPELQRQFPIIALGSVWPCRDGRRDVPGLWGFTVERDLRLDCFGLRWDDDYRFLAFRK